MRRLRMPGRLQGQILVVCLVSFLVLLVIGTASTVYLVNHLLLGQAQEKVEGNLRSARAIYDARLERLGEFVRFGASLPDLRRALIAGDEEGLGTVLASLRVRQGEDMLSLTDPRGRVVLRARNPSAAGDDMSDLGPVGRALLGEPSASTEVLSAVDLRAEGEDLAGQARISVVPSPGARPGAPGETSAGLALVAAAPVLGVDGRVAGVLYGADLLNQDYALVDRIRATVFGHETGDGRPLGTAALFLGEVRVSTNVAASADARAIGTRVPAEVAERVLDHRVPWTDRSFAVDGGYLSAYEPLVTSDGKVVGILHVGLPVGPYRTLAWTSLGPVGASYLIGTVLGLALAAVLARSVARPLGRLTREVRRMASGDLSARLDLGSADEIGDLARQLDALTASLRRREAEIETRTGDLERRVAQSGAELERVRQERLALAHRQDRTNEALDRSNERLEASRDELVRSGRLAALGALAAGVAHEINNPLAVIQGNVEILALRGRSDPELADEIDLIADQTERMRRITASLLIFARPEETVRESVDLGGLVERAVEGIRGEAGQGGVDIRRMGPPKLPPVVGDRGRLAQVFVNLVDNALRAMPGGGVLTVGHAVGDDGTVSVSVGDTGPGIPPAEQDQVWNPFYTTRPAGTGLGLSICHSVVEEHGGRILLDSQPGRGSVFTVVLPGDGDGDR